MRDIRLARDEAMSYERPRAGSPEVRPGANASAGPRAPEGAAATVPGRPSPLPASILAAFVASTFVASTFVAPATAGRSTDEFAVSATVQDGCAVTEANLDFGVYTIGQEADLEAIGRIEYAGCGGGVRFELDGGRNPRRGRRHMTFGSHQLGYQLYRDPTYTQTWGEGGDGVDVTPDATLAGRLPIYGRIPSGLLVAPGSYADVVSVLVTF